MVLQSQVWGLVIDFRFAYRLSTILFSHDPHMTGLLSCCVADHNCPYGNGSGRWYPAIHQAKSQGLHTGAPRDADGSDERKG